MIYILILEMKKEYFFVKVMTLNILQRWNVYGRNSLYIGIEIYNDIFQDIIGLYQSLIIDKRMLGSFSFDDKLQLE